MNTEMVVPSALAEPKSPECGGGRVQTRYWDA